MKTILCYGDSNTWGWVPGRGSRHPYEKRWTGILQRLLGPGFRVVDEGLSGRTTVFDDPNEPDRNGRSFLPVCLQTHAPLDLVIVMLGTNDCKSRFGLSAAQIAEGAGELARIVQTTPFGVDGKPAKALLVAPPPIVFTDANRNPDFEGAEEKSRGFTAAFQAVAARLGCGFFDAGAAVSSSRVDGIHLDETMHARLAARLAAVVGAA